MCVCPWALGTRWDGARANVLSCPGLWGWLGWRLQVTREVADRCVSDPWRRPTRCGEVGGNRGASQGDTCRGPPGLFPA